MNPVYTLTPYHFKIHFIVSHLRLRLPIVLFPSVFLTKNLVCILITLLSCVLHIHAYLLFLHDFITLKYLAGSTNYAVFCILVFLSFS